MKNALVNINRNYPLLMLMCFTCIKTINYPIYHTVSTYWMCRYYINYSNKTLSLRMRRASMETCELDDLGLFTQCQVKDNRAFSVVIIDFHCVAL